MGNVKIKAIKKIKSRNKYDLEIEKNHNFFANDILVHNCRCLTIKKDGNVKFFSRQGKEILTLNNLIEDIQKSNLEGYVLDGEICLVDENGDEDFQSIMKEIRKKDYSIENPKYKVFDVLTFEDFIKRESKTKFSTRQKFLKEELKETKKIEIVEQIPINSVEEMMKMFNGGIEKGWEGLILRKDCPYKGKRSNDLLKVKKFNDAEYKIESIETGPYRIISKETGLEETIETLTAVHINHKGFDVKVGSGFSLEQRKKIYDSPEDFIGKEITVSYFEETTNQNGGTSLRFPTVKYIFDNNRDI